MSRYGARLLACCVAMLTGCAPAPNAPHQSGPTSPGPLFSAPLPVTPTAGSAVPGRFVRLLLGRSVEGRALLGYRLGRPDAPHRVLVIGVVHGDETAGMPIVRGLLEEGVPPGTELVVVPDINPDGVAAGTRQNARHVDLNRNFPYAWAPIGRPGDQQYSGTGPLSEPESRAVVALVRSLRPAVTVWFHQPVGVVDDSGGRPAVEQRFADLLGEPLRRMTRYPGSAASWQNAIFPGSSAFVVELPGKVDAALVRRALHALRDLER